MARRRKAEKIIYNYECSLTGEKYTTTQKATNPEELISVKAYYELNPDKDDRPLIVKKQLGLLDSEE